MSPKEAEEVLREKYNYSDSDIKRLKTAADDFDMEAGAGEQFKKVNPDISDEAVERINEQHEKNKDVVKEKHAAGTDPKVELFDKAYISAKLAHSAAAQGNARKAASYGVTAIEQMTRALGSITPSHADFLSAVGEKVDGKRAAIVSDAVKADVLAAPAPAGDADLDDFNAPWSRHHYAASDDYGLGVEAGSGLTAEGDKYAAMPTTKQVKKLPNGWTLTWNPTKPDHMSVDDDEGGTWSDEAMLFRGKITYDFPERIPVDVRDAVRKFFNLLKRSKSAAEDYGLTAEGLEAGSGWEPPAINKALAQAIAKKVDRHFVTDLLNEKLTGRSWEAKLKEAIGKAVAPKQMRDLVEAQPAIKAWLSGLGSSELAKIRDLLEETLNKGKAVQYHSAPDAWKSASEGYGLDITAKFPKGKPADPTENMTDEDAAEWAAMNEQHADKFKTASDEIEIEYKVQGKDWTPKKFRNGREFEAWYDKMHKKPGFEINEESVEGHSEEYLRSLMASENYGLTADDDKAARFEQGKPADPTENMTDEDAAEWQANTEQYGDKFKTVAVEKKIGKNVLKEAFEDTDKEGMTWLKQIQNKLVHTTFAIAVESKFGRGPNDTHPKNPQITQLGLDDVEMSQEAGKWYTSQTGAVQFTMARQILMAEAKKLGIKLDRTKTVYAADAYGLGEG